jgi:ATP-dependent Lhr-like helicase
VFSKIEKEEYNYFIEDMVEKGFIEENGPYINLGDAFEKEFGKRNFLEFYSVFWPNYEFKVQEGRKSIGTLDASFVISTLKNGSNFVLGGEVWTVTKSDHDNFKLNGKKAKEGVVPNWKSEGSAMDYLLARKIYDILLIDYNEELLKHFDRVAHKIIKNLQEDARISGFKKQEIPVEFSFYDNRVFIYTFGGFKVNSLISTIFKFYHDVSSARDTPYYSSFKFKNLKMSEIEYIGQNIKDILEDKELEKFMFSKTKKFIKNKFIKYLPENDQAELKTCILFNKEDTIDLFENNSLKLIDSSDFSKW